MIFYWMAGNMEISAQSQSAQVSHVPFNQLTFEQKRINVLSWINQSQNILIPQNYDEAFKDFYIKNGLGAAVYQKYQVILRVPFNANLNLQDRIHVCEFLLENYQPSDMPLATIHSYLESLLQLNIKR